MKTGLFANFSRINCTFGLSLSAQEIATMSKKIIITLLLFSGLILLYRCSTDVDLYADYKDITIVYGILDVSDDTSWIKITRAFAGPGNALQIAQNPDSSNYSYKLDVTITGEKQGEGLTSVKFDTITIKNKKPGDSIFYFPNQLMYYAVSNLDVDADYTLSIRKKKDEVISQTHLIKDFSITSPRNRVNFKSDNVKFEWTSPKNGKRYEVFYVFNYQQWVQNSHDTSDLSVTFSVGSTTSESVNGGDPIAISDYDGQRFFNKLENELKLKPSSDTIRLAGSVDVYVSAGSQELQNYLAINNSSGSLLEEVPVYTNIENGTGLFASRHTSSKSVALSTVTLNSLVDMDLGFILPSK